MARIGTSASLNCGNGRGGCANASFKTTDALVLFVADEKQRTRITEFYARFCGTTGSTICSRFAELITMFSTVNSDKRNGMHERRVLKAKLDCFPKRQKLDLLTKRQREIVEGLAKGLSYREVAASLGMHPHTLSTHVRSIQRKFPFSGRVELLLHFYEFRERDA